MVYMDWTDSHRRINEGVTVSSYRTNRLLVADDLSLLEFSQQGLQHAFYRFFAACDQA